MTAILAQTPQPVSEDGMQQYMQEIRSIPRLTEQEERALAKRCAQGDQEAIRLMVSANLRLVVSVAREYAGRGVPMLDLIQEGSIGLLAAAKKFDYTLDYRFSTYATKWIRQGISRCLENHGELIRVPAYTAQQLRQLSRARADYIQTHGAEPTAAQLAESCSLPEEKVEKLLTLQPQLVSLDAPVGEERTIGVLLEDLQAPEPQEKLVLDELQATINHLLSQLEPRQQQVLRLRFGMDGESWSLDRIGQRLGISKERVRQIEKQSIQQLKKMGADFGLEDFLA